MGLVKAAAVLLLLTGMPFARGQMAGAPAPAAPSTAVGILSAADAGQLFPATVFFEGKTAPVQARNAGGVRLGTQAVVLAALIDSSGYSSKVQEKYQLYLIAEVPVLFGTQTLAAGAYGCGFLPDNTFLVMDIGGHTLFTVPSLRDADLRHPTPLQMTGTGKDGEYRLYEGRSYVAFRAAQP